MGGQSFLMVLVYARHLVEVVDDQQDLEVELRRWMARKRGYRVGSASEVWTSFWSLQIFLPRAFTKQTAYVILFELE